MCLLVQGGINYNSHILYSLIADGKVVETPTTSDFNTSDLIFGGSQTSAYLCNAFLSRRILRAFILPSRGQG
jgi:hypothetical protein